MTKTLNYKSIEVSDVHWEDYPDILDGQIDYAEWEDGTPLTCEEIGALYDDGAFIYELFSEHVC